MEKDFNSLDLYDKLIHISYTCFTVRTGFESIVNEYAAQEYIAELLNKIELIFPCFLDEDVNREETFGADFKDYQTEVESIMVIVLLLKKREASYTYLINDLHSIENIIENSLPDNLRTARFFKKLLNNKTRIAETLGVDEHVFSDIMDKCVKQTDSIMEIIDHNQEDKKEYK